MAGATATPSTVEGVGEVVPPTVTDGTNVGISVDAPVDAAGEIPSPDLEVLEIKPKFVDRPSQSGLGMVITTSDLVISPAFYDGASSNSPLGVILGLTPDEPVLEVQIYGPAGINQLAVVENAYEVEWVDELNGAGWGSFLLQIDDSDAAQCVEGRMVRFYINDVPVFTYQIEGRPRLVQVDSEEEVNHFLEVRGRGWASTLDSAATHPSYDLLASAPDLDDPFKQEWRSFNFASIDFPNGQAWPNAVERYEYGELQSYRFERVETSEDTYENVPAPDGFPFPNSEIYSALATDDEKCHWITPPVDPSSPGFFFFAGILVWEPAVAEPVTFATTADNLFTLFINGVPVLDEQDDHFMWKGWKEVTVPLEAGWYRIACVVENVPNTVAVGETNHGGWLMGSFVRGADGNPKSGAITTNGNYKSLYSAEIWPGWTPGQIVERLIIEATGRGALLSGAIGYNFTATADSAGDPWEALQGGGVITSYIPNFSIRVGSTLLEALDQLVEEGWVNWNMPGGGTTLNMWSAGTAQASPKATFTIGSNIRSLERAPSEPHANSLLVAWEKGYVKVEDASDIATNGRYELLWDSKATSATEATRMGEVELERRIAGSDTESVVMAIESTALTDLPYWAFGVGDVITIPDADNVGTTNMKVMSISCQLDDEGNPLFTLELNRRWPNEDRQAARLDRKAGGAHRTWRGVLE